VRAAAAAAARAGRRRVTHIQGATASLGGRGQSGRCRPHPPLWLTTAAGARHPPAGDAAATSRAACGAAAGGHLGGRAGGGGGGRPPVCIRDDSGASASCGVASDGTGMRVSTRETFRPGLAPPLPRPPAGGHCGRMATRRPSGLYC